MSNKGRCLSADTQPPLQVPRTVLVTYGDTSFAYAVPILWNVFPIECKEVKGVECVKSKLKTHMFKKAFSVYIPASLF